MPSALRDAVAAGGSGRSAWLEELPGHVEHLIERWGLVLEDPFEPGGQCSWVAPGVDRDGREVVLKVAWAHSEALHEADGLSALGGRSAVEVYEVAHFAPNERATRSHPVLGGTTAMLLERCRPGERLRDRPEAEQHPIIVDLLRSAWATELPPDHPFRPLSTMADDWVASAEARLGGRPGLLDPGVARDGLTLFVDLARPQADDVLLLTDLHAGNVLSSRRHRWLVIDPKPYVGDRHYDVTQHLLNCATSLQSNPVRLMSAIADRAGLDASRLRHWLFARCVQEILSDAEHWPGLDTVLPRLRPG